MADCKCRRAPDNVHIMVQVMNVADSAAMHPPRARLAKPVLWEIGERLHLHFATHAVRRPNPANLYPLLLHTLVFLRLCCCCFYHCGGASCWGCHQAAVLLACVGACRRRSSHLGPHNVLSLLLCNRCRLHGMV